MRRSSLAFIICLSVEWLAGAPPAAAQAELSGCRTWVQQSLGSEQVGENHVKLLGSADTAVVITCDDTEFSADAMELFKDQDRLVARGSVVFVSGGNRIHAERLDFNTKTKLGTFYTATGTATLGDKVERSLFGTQEPYVYFWGAELHKIGPKKYRIVRGGFTTCVQPTPRWEIVSDSATLTLEEYALLRNSLFKVKGVPLMYLPLFYYPIQEDDRATGFLIPTYGNSTYRGQTISNAFFWAISRSQDATFVHDWFSRTGQGYGGEYRYIASGASTGTARVYIVNEHEATFSTGGRTIDTPARRSYEFRGSARQSLPLNTQVNASADYFSNVTVQQLYNQNLYEASLSSRNFGVSASSRWSGFTLTGNFNRNEYFYGSTDSTVYGARPQVSFSRSATRVWRLPIYLNGTIAYANQQRESFSRDVIVHNANMQRWDGGGSIRVPFPAWSFLSVNSSIGWNATRYQRSVDTGTGGIVPVGLFRDYFDLRTEIAGPRLVRIWSRPTRRIKHLIEPSVEFRRLTAITNVDKIVKLEYSDYLTGGSLQTRYGISTRLFVKPAGESAVSRELLNVTVHQTHYRNPRDSQVDLSYSTSFLGRPPSNFSPVLIAASVTPAEGKSGDVRIEYDPVISALQSFSAGGTVRQGAWLNVTAAFSQRRIGGGSLLRSDNYLSVGSSLRTPGNSVGGAYSFNYDFGRKNLIQQRILAYYNAQCCGIGFEYQTYNYPASSAFVIPQDRRFNLSFTLAGIGTFSNFLGALTGQPTNR